MTVKADVRFAVLPEWLLDSDISAQAIRLYAVLARYADKETGEAYPSQATIAARLRCSVDTVQRRTAELKEAGAISVQHRKTDLGDPDTILYTVHILPGGPRKSARTGPRTDAAQTRVSRNERTSPTGMAQSAEKANGQTFSQRLATELISGRHGVRWSSYETRHESVRALLEEALARLPKNRHHPTAMGVIADYVAEVQGWKMTPQARNHTARLVKLHKPLAVLDAYGQAMAWGAGIAPEYAEDPLSLSKYVAGVLGGKRSRA